MVPSANLHGSICEEMPTHPLICHEFRLSSVATTKRQTQVSHCRLDNPYFSASSLGKNAVGVDLKAQLMLALSPRLFKNMPALFPVDNVLGVDLVALALSSMCSVPLTPIALEFTSLQHIWNHLPPGFSVLHEV
jgi:hypothetical protein